MKVRGNRFIFILATFFILFPLLSFSILATTYNRNFDDNFDLTSVNYNTSIYSNNDTSIGHRVLTDDLGIWYAGKLYNSNIENITSTSEYYWAGYGAKQTNFSEFNSGTSILFAIDLYDFTLETDTVMCVDWNTTAASSTPTQFDVILGNDNGNCVALCTTANCYNVDDYLCTGTKVPYDVWGWTQAGNNVTRDCTDLSAVASQYFTQYDNMYLILFDPTTHNDPNDIYLHNFTIHDYTGNPFIEGNELPECEFSVNDSNICWEYGWSYADLDISITCNDTEGDTIYYGHSELDYMQRYTHRTEDFNYYSFFTDGFFYSNYSYSNDYDEAQLYVSGWTIEPYNIIGQLQGNNILITDNGVEEWNYLLEEVLYNSTTHSMILGFPDDDTKLEILAVGSLFEEIYNVTFEQSSTNLSITIDGTNVYNANQDLMTGSWDNYLIFSAAYNNTDVYIDIVHEDGTSLYSNNITSIYAGFKGFRFLTYDSHSLEKDFWIMDSLVIRGWNYHPEPTWSTTIPYNITITDSYYQYITLYVTDSGHIGVEWNTYTELIDISPIYCEDDAGLLVDEDGIHALVQIPRTFMNGTGTLTIFQTALWYAYFLLFLFLIWTTKGDVLISFILTNIAFFLCAWSFGTVTQLISAIVLLSVSIVAKVFIR